MAYDTGRIANVDDDYNMDDLEELEQFQEQFSKKVQIAFDRREPPFESAELSDQIYDAIQSHRGLPAPELLDINGKRDGVNRRINQSAATSVLSETVASAGSLNPRP